MIDSTFVGLVAKTLRRPKMLGRCAECRKPVRSDQKYIRLRGGLYHKPKCVRYVRR